MSEHKFQFLRDFIAENKLPEDPEQREICRAYAIAEILYFCEGDITAWRNGMAPAFPTFPEIFREIRILYRKQEIRWKRCWFYLERHVMNSKLELIKKYLIWKKDWYFKYRSVNS